MNIRKCAVFVYVIFLSIHCFAQELQTDSIETVIKKLNDDSAKVIVLNDLSSLLWKSQPDQSIEYANEARDLGYKINYKTGVAYALKNIGMGYYTKGKYIEVLESWQRSLAVFDSIGDKIGVSNLLNNLGAVYFNQGDDVRAIEYYLRSLKVAEEIGDTLRIASALLNIGNVYLNKDETLDISLEYLFKGLALAKEIGDQDAIGNASVNIGEIYLRRDNYDSALYYFEKSLTAYEIDGSGSGPYALNNIGKVYTKIGMYDSAITHHNEAYKIAEQINDKLQMAQSLLGLANAYNKKQNYREAVSSYIQAEIITKEIGATKELKEVYEGISQVYAEIHDFTKAYKYQALVTKINLDIYNTENDKKIERLQFSYEIEEKQGEIDLLEKNSIIEQLKTKRQKAISTGIGIAGFLILILGAGLFSRYKYIHRTKQIIEAEKDRSENLLLNILPHETAEELKTHGEAKARRYEMVSIIFTDFKGFTALSSNLSPEELVKEIHHCYKAFDEIVTHHGIEKIKTIGDAYMAAGGLPVPNETHALDVLRAAIEIRDFMTDLRSERQEKNQPYFDIRIGIHSGPVVAGIVGTKKFAYDIWGDTVNIASRMESNSEPGKINISKTTYELIKDLFVCTPRGAINVKGGGDKIMYFVEEEVKQFAETG
jgi:class 3 adenylate cyclase